MILVIIIKVVNPVVMNKNKLINIDKKKEVKANLIFL